MAFFAKYLTLPPIRIISALAKFVLILFGFMLTIIFLFFLVLSLPIYLYRLILPHFAHLFRPDLHSLVNPHSCLFVHDFFKISTSRSNVVTTCTLEGDLTFHEFKYIVLKKWILPKHPETLSHLYPQFQQYPVSWLGFYFWRWDPKFSLDEHLHLVPSLISTQEDLNNLVESILNLPLRQNQSPWEFYLVPKYQENRSVLIFKVHHTLADGFSIVNALINGLDKCSGVPNIPQRPQPKYTQRTSSILEKLQFILTFPFKVLWESCYYNSYMFRRCAWQVSDNHKTWWQVTSISEPIPIQMVKEIKNHFGVSFSSVLISGFSTAITKSLDESMGNNAMSPILCCSLLPVMNPNYRENHKLTNLLTGALFELPLNCHPANPATRLMQIDKTLRTTSQSVNPILLTWYGMLVGGHLNVVSGFLAKNRIVSMALTNFAGVPISINLNGKPLVDVDFRAGLLEGVCGGGIMVLSYKEQIRVGIVVENSIMDRANADLFVKRVLDEIYYLREICNIEH